MTTIVNNPVPETETVGSGFVIGMIAIIVIMVGVFVYMRFPAMRNDAPAQINVSVPQVQIPDKIDVNVVPTQ